MGKGTIKGVLPEELRNKSGLIITFYKGRVPQWYKKDSKELDEDKKKEEVEKREHR